MPTSTTPAIVKMGVHVSGSGFDAFKKSASVMRAQLTEMRASVAGTMGGLRASITEIPAGKALEGLSQMGSFQKVNAALQKASTQGPAQFNDAVAGVVKSLATLAPVSEDAAVRIMGSLDKIGDISGRGQVRGVATLFSGVKREFSGLNDEMSKTIKDIIRNWSQFNRAAVGSQGRTNAITDIKTAVDGVAGSVNKIVPAAKAFDSFTQTMIKMSDAGAITGGGLQKLSQTGSGLKAVLIELTAEALNFDTTGMSMKQKLQLLPPGIQQIANSLDNMTGSLGTSGEAMGAMEKETAGLSKEASRLNMGYDRMQGRIRAASHSMRIFSSTMQGAIAATSLLQGSLIGFLFSLAFSQFAIQGVFWATITLVSAIGLVTKSIAGLGKSLDGIVTKFKALTGTMKESAHGFMMVQKWSIATGQTVDDVAEAFTHLRDQGLLMGNAVNAVFDLAAARGITAAEAAKAYASAVGDTKESLESLHQYDVRVNKSAIDLTNRRAVAEAAALAIMQRYPDAAKEMANSGEGALKRIKASFSAILGIIAMPIWKDFMTPLLVKLAAVASNLYDVARATLASERFQELWNESLELASGLLKTFAPELDSLAKILRGAVVGAMYLFLGVVRLGIAAVGFFLSMIRAAGTALSIFGINIKPVWDMLRMLAQALKGLNLRSFLQAAKEWSLDLPKVMRAGLFALGTFLSTVWTTMLLPSIKKWFGVETTDDLVIKIGRMWKGIKEAVRLIFHPKELWAKIKGGAGGGLDDAWKALLGDKKPGGFAKFLDDIFKGDFKSAIRGLPRLFAGFVDDIFKGLGGLLGSIPKLLTGLFKSGLKAIPFILVDILGGLLIDSIPGLTDKARETLHTVFDAGMWGATIGSLFGPMGTVIGGLLGALGGYLFDKLDEKMGGKLRQWFKEDLPRIWDDFIGSIKSFIANIKIEWQKIKDAFDERGLAGAWDAIKDVFGRGGAWLGEKIAEIWENVRAWAQAFAPKVGEWLLEKAGDIGTALGKLVGEFLVFVVTTLPNWMETELKPWAEDFVPKMVSFLETNLPKLAEWVGKLPEVLYGAAVTVGEDIGKFAGVIWGHITKMWDEFLWKFALQLQDTAGGLPIIGDKINAWVEDLAKKRMPEKVDEVSSDFADAGVKMAADTFSGMKSGFDAEVAGWKPARTIEDAIDIITIPMEGNMGTIHNVPASITIPIVGVSDPGPSGGQDSDPATPYATGGSGIAWHPTTIRMGEIGPEAFAIAPLGHDARQSISRVSGITPMLGGAGGHGSASGGVQIHIDLRGSHVLSTDDANRLGNVIGNAIAKRVRRTMPIPGTMW